MKRYETTKQNVFTAIASGGVLASMLAVSASLWAESTSGQGEESAARIMDLGLRGVHFIPNRGQWSDESVHYAFRTDGLDIAFRESSLTMHLHREISAPDGGTVGDELASLPPSAGISPAPQGQAGGTGLWPVHRRDACAPVEYERLVLEVTFPGSNAALPRGVQPQSARFNYFLGDDADHWASDVPSFGRIVYENIYDGVDLHVMGAADGRGVLKYEFHAQPGADHEQVRIRYDGIETLGIDEATGDLLIETSFGTLRDTAPVVWQDDGCRRSHGPSREYLPAQFELLGGNEYTFTLLSTPDPSLPLVLDPVVDWMYYLGGSNEEWGVSVAVDGAGNALMTGATHSTDFGGRNNSFHGTPPFSDAFALKVSPSGQLQWMTYLGGSGGDSGHGIAVDGAGNALVTGSTSSNDFAGRNNSNPGGIRSPFTLKVSPSGQLQWMTYLGGSGWDSGRGIAVDSAGNALVTGYTSSDDFAGRTNSFNLYWDAFALKVNSSGQLQWMIYLGGTRSDRGYGVAVDSAGNAFVTGSTLSDDFSGRLNSSQGDGDAFVLKVNPSGQLQWMRYLGGSRGDWGYGIAVDESGRGVYALVTGGTKSTDFFGRNNSYPGGGWSAFTLKVNTSGQLLWMTYLGGRGQDEGYGVAVDAAGNALVTGVTSSNDFAGRNNQYFGGSLTGDAFALKVDPFGQLQWMTYLGGSEDDWGSGIAVDGAGDALVTGWTQSTNFDGRNNGFRGGNRDAFLVKLDLSGGGPGLQLSVTASCPGGGPIRVEWQGGTPNGQAALIFAANTGTYTIPTGRPCAGVQLGLGSNQIQVVWQGQSGANGSGVLNATAPPSACGAFLQLLDLAACATSNVEPI